MSDPSSNPVHISTMHTSTRGARPGGQPASRSERNRVLTAAAIGTTFEWYDFFIYATAAQLIFASQYFSGLSSTMAILAALGSIGVSFVARPLGGIIAGHFGDRIGRKRMLMITLLLMGGATVGVGLIPTYAQIGVAAPAILVTLRFLQGLSAGGEWGGAAAMAVEYAPANRRGTYGTAIGIAVPLGLILANGIYFIVQRSMSPEAFQSWGWRLPFLFSAALFVLGLVIRARVRESPAFEELRGGAEERPKIPLGTTLRYHGRSVLLGTGVFIANTMFGYILLGFTISYGVRQLQLPATAMTMIIVCGGLIWLLAVCIAGPGSDRIGRRRMYLIGAVVMLLVPFPFFALLQGGSVATVILATALLCVGIGITYGTQTALFCELFPTSVRYSGATLAYNLGAVVGGGFAPMIAERLLQQTGSWVSIAVYMTVGAVISLIAGIALRPRDLAGFDRSVAAAADIPDRSPGAGLRPG